MSVRVRAWALLRHEARLQYRYGIYAAYGFVIAVYVAVLVAVAPLLPAWGTAAIVFTDPSALGFFFLGALMMLERNEGVRRALAAAPVTARDYLAAKVATLTGMAVLASMVLTLFLHRPAAPALLILAVVLTSLQYVGIGVPIALRFRTVSGYLVGSTGFLTPLIAPGFLALLDPMPDWLLLVPAASQFRLMLVATGAVAADPVQILTMLAVAALAALAALWYALWALRKELGK
ncbi:MAG: hypothetical protein IPK28_18290 [Devosia sp.]|nr:hypothetical protein [Devosia sp.]